MGKSKKSKKNFASQPGLFAGHEEVIKVKTIQNIVRPLHKIEELMSKFGQRIDIFDYETLIIKGIEQDLDIHEAEEILESALKENIILKCKMTDLRKIDKLVYIFTEKINLIELNPDIKIEILNNE